MTSSTKTPEWKRDEERFIEKRGRYIASTTSLSDNEAQAVACAELGYTASGAAKIIGCAETTAKAYYKTAAGTLSPGALLTKLPGEIQAEAPV